MTKGLIEAKNIHVMSIWLIENLFAFSVSVLLTGFLIPQILLIAFRNQLFDSVDERKIHKGSVPRLGGIAFMPAVLFSTLLVVGINIYLNPTQSGGAGLVGLFLIDAMPLCFVICAIVLLYLTGMADDLVGVKYRAKFVVQILAAILFILGGVVIDNLHGFLWINEIPEVMSWLLTVLLVVYIVNAVNLIDGLDGLASGLGAIALCFYGTIFLEAGKYIYSLIAFADLGTLLPFFYFNVFGNVQKHKKIFMGDTGSLTTGAVIAMLAIVATGLHGPEGDWSINPIVVAYSPLIIPCFDVLRVYLHRLVKGRNPFLPDRSHIHHKLIALGLPQRLAMISLLLFSCAFVVINLLLSPYVNPTLLFIADLIIWTFGNIGISAAIRRRELLLGKRLYD